MLNHVEPLPKGSYHKSNKAAETTWYNAVGKLLALLQLATSMQPVGGEFHAVLWSSQHSSSRSSQQSLGWSPSPPSGQTSRCLRFSALDKPNQYLCTGKGSKFGVVSQILFHLELDHLGIRALFELVLSFNLSFSAGSVLQGSSEDSCQALTSKTTKTPALIHLCHVFACLCNEMMLFSGPSRRSLEIPWCIRCKPSFYTCHGSLCLHCGVLSCFYLLLFFSLSLSIWV